MGIAVLGVGAGGRKLAERVALADVAVVVGDTPGTAGVEAVDTAMAKTRGEVRSSVLTVSASPRWKPSPARWANGFGHHNCCGNWSPPAKPGSMPARGSPAGKVVTR